MEDLEDFPYQGTRRPFDFILKEEKVDSFQTTITSADNADNAWADLRLAIYLYMMNRKRFYINYMAGAKYLFASILLPGTVTSYLKEPDPYWHEGITKEINFSYLKVVKEGKGKGWHPAYEIQRLWLATGIHWSWLEKAWAYCAQFLWVRRGVNVYETQ